jgi:hypothetical protein
VNFSDEDEQPKKPIVKKSNKTKEDSRRLQQVKTHEDQKSSDDDQALIKEPKKDITKPHREKKTDNENAKTIEKTSISIPTDKVQKESKEDQIKGEEVVKQNHNQSNSYFNLIIENIRDFVYTLPPKEQDVKCRITRDVKGIEKGLHPTFYMHFERDDGRKVFLLAARKTNFGIKSKYFISIDPVELTKKGQNYVGVLT